jgi:membrane-bound inhibitor of C-type lysozyme
VKLDDGVYEDFAYEKNPLQILQATEVPPALPEDGAGADFSDHRCLVWTRGDEAR